MTEAISPESRHIQEILTETAALLAGERLEKTLQEAAEALPGGRLHRVGKTREGRPMFGLSAGNGQHAVFYLGGVHGQEGITALLLLRFAEELTEKARTAAPFCGLPGEVYWQRAGIFLLPCMNMDGVARAEPLWQANAAGVDLNHNFDAGWALCRQAEQEGGIFGPGPTRFGGKRPFSEPESRAVKRLCRRRQFQRMIAFHSQGEEIYGGHGAKTDPTTQALGNLMHKLSGYRFCKPTASALHGGAKDWFYDTFSKPAFTLEVGKGQNPLPPSDTEEIYGKLRRLLFVFPLL